MRKSKTLLASIFTALSLTSSPTCANTADFTGGVAIGSSYAGVYAAPSNGLIVQGLQGIGSSSPITSLDISQKSDAIALPVGTSGTRPTGGTLTNGEIRYNSSLPGIEAYVNGAWTTLLGGGVLGVANGGTGTSTAFTLGSVIFTGTSGVYAQNNTNLFWDNTNTRLGIGTSIPVAELDVHGGIKTGTDSDTCSSTIEGTQRYNTTTHGYEYCNGTSWTSFGGSGSVPSGSFCGSWAHDDLYGVETTLFACQGVTTYNACPTGYTFTKFAFEHDDASENHSFWTCVAN